MTRYTVESRWDSPAASTAEATYNRLIALGAKEPSSGFLRDVIDTLYEFGPMPDVDLNADLMVAHCANETGDPNTGAPFRSPIYMTRGVIDGLGVTDGGDQGLSFKSGRNAALAHMVHLFAYVHGEIPKRHPLYGYTLFDPRYQLVINGGHAGEVTTVKSMTGWWWTDSSGHTSVIKQALSIFDEFTSPVEPGGPQMVQDSTGVTLNMSKGLVPFPGFADRTIPDGQNMAWDDLGQRSIKGFVLHRMLGSLTGTDSYFRTMRSAQQTKMGGLTDNGTSATSRTIYQWNRPTGEASPGISANRAGWATGPYNTTGSAYGDGKKFADKYGLNAINRDQRSWEIDGFYGDPWSDDSMDEAAQACAHDAHNYGITWEQFPIAPQDGFSFLRWHNEFTGTDYKECPGSVVMAQTDEFIAIVKGKLKAAQQVLIDVPEPPKPTPIPVSPYPKNMTEALAREFYGSVTVPWSSKPFVFDINRPECRAWLHFGSSAIPEGGDYTDGNWGTLTKVIRRGNKGDKGRVYRYSNGFVYQQEPASQQTGKQAA